MTNTTKAFKTFNAAFIAEFAARAEHYNTRFAALSETFAVSQNDDDKAAMQKALCYSQSFSKLATLDAARIEILHALKIDAALIDKARDVRETVKRVCLILDALANNTRVKDKALHAVLSFIVAKSLDTVTNAQCMREAQHDTTRQADAMLNVFESTNCILSKTKIDKVKSYALNVTDDNLLTRLLTIYRADVAKAA